MNLNRLRPPKGPRVDLELWLSSVINDAIRDVTEAGLPERTVHSLLSTITDMHDPDSYKYKYRSTTVANNTKPATLFDVRVWTTKREDETELELRNNESIDDFQRRVQMEIDVLTERV